MPNSFKSVSFVVPLLGLGDEFDFDQGGLGEILHGECATGGEGGRKELGIDLVHGAEVGDVAEEDGGLHDIAQVEPLTLEDGTCVEQALAGLFLHASLGEGSGFGDDGQLARYEHEVAGADSLVIRTDGSRCLVSV